MSEREDPESLTATALHERIATLEETVARLPTSPQTLDTIAAMARFATRLEPLAGRLEVLERRTKATAEDVRGIGRLTAAESKAMGERIGRVESMLEPKVPEPERPVFTCREYGCGERATARVYTATSGVDASPATYLCRRHVVSARALAEYDGRIFMADPLP